MEKEMKWFVIRTPLGQEQKSMDYLSGKGFKTFTPIVTKIKKVDGVPTPVIAYRLPFLFFAQGTEQTLKPFVERNPDAPYLHFFCSYSGEVGKRRRQIITIPDVQMDSFIKICETGNPDIRICNEVIHKFAKGEYVRVTAGAFEGVQGRMVSIYGKKRVGIVIANTLTVMTSYIPDAFWEKVEEE
jgi:hypothetical protein